MKTENTSLRFALLAFLAVVFLSGGAFAEDGEDDQPPVAKEEAAPVKPQAAPASTTSTAKSKAAAPAPAKKASAPTPTKPKAPEAVGVKKPDAASGKTVGTEPSKEKPAKVGKPETKNAEAQKAVEGAAPAVTVPVEAPVPPPPPPMPRPSVAPKKESGGFFQRLFGGGDKKPEAKASSMRQRPEPPRRPFDAGIPRPMAEPSGMPPVDPAKDIDPKRLDAAKKVAKHFEVKDKIESAIRAPLRSVQFRLRSENADKFDKIQAVVEETVKAEAGKHEEAGRENKAIFLAQNYTVDELKQLESFFGSEAGQKTIKLWSLMAQRDMAFGQNVAAHQATGLREAALKKAKKEGLKIPEALEKQ